MNSLFVNSNFLSLFMELADLMLRIKPSPTIAMSNRARELKAGGVDVIDFSVGEPDLATPKHVCDAVIDALNKGFTKYTAVDGTVGLKQAIIDKLERENGLEYLQSEISVGTGAKQVIFNALAATLNEGDEVIIPTPSWVSYVDIVAMFGGKPVLVETFASEGFCLSGAKLANAITSKTKWVILNSPSNPTGAVYTKNQLREIADVLLQNPHINLMSDDIYEHIIFDGLQYTNILNIAPELYGRTLIINGVSKAYSMTGFRIGYGAIKNTKLINAMRTIQSQSTSNPNSIAQHAAMLALSSNESVDFYRNMSKLMQEKRDLVLSALIKMAGVKPFGGSGAFYVFSSIEDLIGKTTKGGKVIKSGEDFCNYLLDQAYVATVPGEAFGIKDHFRISFATDIEVIKHGLGRIEVFVSSLV